MGNDTIKDKLRKIYKLAQQGSDGERQAAQSRLDALLEKYDLHLSDIAEEALIDVKFRCRDNFEERLLDQIVASVTKSMNVRKWSIRRAGKKVRNVIGYDLTKTQAVECEFLFEEYRKLWKDEQVTFFKAFIHKHSLYAPPVEGRAALTDDEMEEAMRLRQMSHSLKNANLSRKRINP